MKRIIVIAALAASVAGCSTIFEGTSQDILVNTNPAGADCALSRDGAAIGRVTSTPGVATIAKTRSDITIRCDKSGYETASYLDPSGFAGAGLANIILPGGSIGLMIDAATGADNKYDSPVTITLVPSRAAELTPAQDKALVASAVKSR